VSSALWISTFTGERRGSKLRDPQPIHGALSDTRVPIWIQHDGKRLQVARKVDCWNVYDPTICACCWEMEMADGSVWLLVHDLIKGGWSGEPIETMSKVRG
jgi:hypothetical protein